MPFCNHVVAKVILVPCSVNEIVKTVQSWSRGGDNKHSGHFNDKHPHCKVSNDQEMAQSEGHSHFKNRDGKKLNKKAGTYTKKTYSPFLHYRLVSC